ncbi:hypothetical protein RclHR1_43110001, partial [Rhizophagus clarus]
INILSIHLYMSTFYDLLLYWKRTLFTLSSSTYDINSTSFEELLLKSFKIKLFMDELPTLEHTKTYFYHLYGNANCFLCGDSLEDLSHIWLCSEVIRLTQAHLQLTIVTIQEFIINSSSYSITQHEILSLPI